jgi:hypothetical protein
MTTEENKLPSYDEIMAMSGDNKNEIAQPVEEPQFKVSDEQVKKLVAEALKVIKDRSYYGRNPEIGKMINCPVHGFRHRDTTKCEPKYAYSHTEEDVETGEKTDVFRVLPGTTRNQVIGAAAFKGKRHKPHMNHRKLRFIQIVRDLLPDEYTREDMLAARRKASKMLGMLGKKSFGTMLKPEVKGKSVGKLKYSSIGKMGV